MKLRSLLRIFILFAILSFFAAFVVTLSSPHIITPQTIKTTVDHAPMLR